MKKSAMIIGFAIHLLELTGYHSGEFNLGKLLLKKVDYRTSQVGVGGRESMLARKKSARGRKSA